MMRRIVLEIEHDERYEEIGFPCTEEDLQDTLNDMHVKKEQGAKLFVTKVISPTYLQDLEGRVINLDEINYLAKRMDSFTKEEMDEFAAVVTNEKLNEPKDLINLTFNLNCYTLIQDVSNFAAIGKKQLLSSRVAVSCEEIEKTDLAAIGRELINSGEGIFTERGLLFRNKENTLQEVYDGQVFPQYSFRGDEMACVAISYNGKTEYVYLPEEELAITKALERLGAPEPDVCSYETEYLNKENGEWEQLLAGFLGRENIYDINNLAQIISNDDFDLDKLSAVIQYANAESLNDAIRLAEEIDAFEFIEDANDCEDVGRKIIEKEYEVPYDLEDYINYDGYGEDFQREHSGDFVYGGFVYMDGDKCLRDILSPSDGIKFGGQ